MKRVKITVIRKSDYPDLQLQYENPISNACDIVEGAVFYTDGFAKPDGLCNGLSSWGTRFLSWMDERPTFCDGIV